MSIKCEAPAPQDARCRFLTRRHPRFGTAIEGMNCCRISLHHYKIHGYHYKVRFYTSSET